MTESSIQSSFHKYIWNKYKRTRFKCFHIPNQAKRTGYSYMIAMGMIPGIPDYICLFPAQGFIALFIEFKSATGTLSDKQEKVHNELRSSGLFKVEVVDSLQGAINVFLDYAKETGYLQE